MGVIVAFLIAVLIFLIQWKYFRDHWEKGLSVFLGFKEHEVCVGQPCHLKESVENDKGMPIPTLQVKFQTDACFDFEDQSNATTTDYYYRDDVFSIGGNQRITRTLAFVPKRRGYFRIDAIDLVVWDFFLKEKYLKKQEMDTALYVYPKKFDFTFQEQAFRRIMGELLAKRNILEDPFAFRGIRAYQPFDSIRKINWKSSACHGELLVNTYDPTFSQEIIIFLNANTRFAYKIRESQECAISIASTVAAYFIKAGIAISLYSNARDIVSGELVEVESGSNKQHLNSIDCKLARIDLEQAIMPFAEMIQQKNVNNIENACCLFITSELTTDFLECYEQFKQQGNSAFVIALTDKEESATISSEMIRWEVE